MEDAETPAEKLERKRDYLEGFLSQKPQTEDPAAPGGALYESVIDALREIYDPEIPVNIYDLGLIYGVEVTPEADVMVTMTLTTPHCPRPACPACAMPRSTSCGTRRGDRTR